VYEVVPAKLDVVPANSELILSLTKSHRPSPKLFLSFTESLLQSPKLLRPTSKLFRRFTKFFLQNPRLLLPTPKLLLSFTTSLLPSATCPGQLSGAPWLRFPDSVTPVYRPV
jgi:hypothetical protein